MRFELFHPLIDEKKTKEFLMNYDGIIDFKYNDITKSILINFNNLKVELKEVIIRLTISYSKQYDMMPISVLTSIKNTYTGELQYNINIYQGTSLCNNDKNSNINIVRDLLSKVIDNNQFKLKQSFFMRDNMILDSSQVGMYRSFSI